MKYIFSRKKRRISDLKKDNLNIEKIEVFLDEIIITTKTDLSTTDKTKLKDDLKEIIKEGVTEQ